MGIFFFSFLALHKEERNGQVEREILLRVCVCVNRYMWEN